MSHWAEIDENNIVIRVLVGDNNESDEGEAFMNSLGGTWIKTSYNGNIRKNFAAIGCEYNLVRDAFIPVKPFDSWVLNETTCRWEAPVAMPEPKLDEMCQWNESAQEWIITTIAE
jgi:hypothetical protein